jgi:hypothetical protein
MYGPLHYGSISGVQALVITVAKSVAPLGMGLLFVATGSYQPVLWTLLTASAASIWAMLMVRNVVP